LIAGNLGCAVTRKVVRSVGLFEGCASSERRNIRTIITSKQSRINSRLNELLATRAKDAYFNREQIKEEALQAQKRHDEIDEYIKSEAEDANDLKNGLVCKMDDEFNNQLNGLIFELQRTLRKNKDLAEINKQKFEIALSTFDSLEKQKAYYSDTGVSIRTVGLNLENEIVIYFAVGNRLEHNYLKTNVFKYVEIKNREGGVDRSIVPVGIKLSDNFGNTYEIRDVKLPPPFSYQVRNEAVQAEIEPKIDYLVELNFHRKILANAKTLSLVVADGVFANSKGFNISFRIPDGVVRGEVRTPASE